MCEPDVDGDFRHTQPVRYIVDISSLRYLLIFTPLASTALFFATAAGSTESLAFHLAGTALFAVPFSIFMLVRVIKAGYLVLDPSNERLILSGENIDFSRLGTPRVGEHEVEVMSTQWLPMRGADEGLEIAPGRIILFGTGQSRRKLQKIADTLEEMLEEFRRRYADRGADLRSRDSPPTRTPPFDTPLDRCRLTDQKVHQADRSQSNV